MHVDQEPLYVDQVDPYHAHQRATAALTPTGRARRETLTALANDVLALLAERDVTAQHLAAERAGWALNFDQMRRTLRQVALDADAYRQQLHLAAATATALPHDSACPAPRGGACACWKAQIESLLAPPSAAPDPHTQA